VSLRAPGSTIDVQHPEGRVDSNYFRGTGTSMSAAIVSGAVAVLLEDHGNATPDDVKGALMAGALPLSAAPNPLAFGLGEINLVRAAEMADPPNPNAGLNAFLVADATAAAGTVFDAQSWASAAAADQSWASQSWASQSWSDQSWASQSWASQSWASQSWSDQSWASQSWASQSWSDQSWSDQSWASQSWSDSSQADAALADLSWASGSAVD
jgi:serine protease AprX